jgi:hypothetical protein
MVVVIQIHTRVNLPPQQELPVPFEYEVDWAPERIEIIWNFESIMFLHCNVEDN